MTAFAWTLLWVLLLVAIGLGGFALGSAYFARRDRD